MIVKKDIRLPYIVIVEPSEDGLLSVELVVKGNLEGTYGYCEDGNGFDIWSSDSKDCSDKSLQVYCRFEQFISDSIEYEKSELLPSGLIICWVSNTVLRNIPKAINLTVRTKNEAINYFSNSSK